MNQLRRHSTGYARDQWCVSRLKHYVQLNPPKSEISWLSKDTEVSFLPMEAVSESGEFDLTRVGKISDYASGYTYFRDGDVLLAKITPCFENGKTALVHGLKNGIGFGSTEFHVLRAKENMSRSYLAYVVRSYTFRSYGEAAMIGAAGQKRVPESFISEFKQPFPPLHEQQAIASFLDRETTKLDQLVEKKQRLIELLQEKRQALITHAVTKGLDPNVPMKDSGIPWLGEVPAHWEEKRIKHLADFVTSGSRGWAQFYADSGSIFIRIGNFSHRGTIDLDMTDVQYVAPPPGSEGERTQVRPGDVLISITANLGATAVVPESLGEAYVNQHTALVRPKNRVINSRWLAFSVSAEYAQIQIRLMTQGGTKEGLSLDDVRDITVLVPHKNEQDSIVSHIDRSCLIIEEALVKLQRQIELLGEYRQALITAAVTGQIDVRQYAVSEPEAVSQ
ncbi:restriction modification system DNA specificity domain-containing protein [Alicyclobacillus hesperidum]|uniref:Restriction modification system DNA specificity domain-containing protein n=1 Tax=Alicyclobacillus hesperidum TaxID=89784 RepID=A0AA37U8V9_9BACL|nr:restriction endonuclease subunit S [Alicyclobacillus hesperidum]GLV14952.1 restriction modification system DNA specificity domain-containing protein [Alicyclobacillus hesperidum]